MQSTSMSKVTDMLADSQEVTVSKRPKARKSYVRFDDYLDLNEENMRRSCKRLMNRLYSGPDNAKASQKAADAQCTSACCMCQESLSSSECIPSSLDANIQFKSPLVSTQNPQIPDPTSLGLNNQQKENSIPSAKSPPPQSQTRATTNGKSYLRSQFERRQKRQLAMMRELQLQQQQQQLAEHEQLSADQIGDSSALLTNQMMLAPSKCNLHRSAGASNIISPTITESAGCTGANSGQQNQQDLVAKSHELSKRRFFQELERRESMKNLGGTQFKEPHYAQCKREILTRVEENFSSEAENSRDERKYETEEGEQGGGRVESELVKHEGDQVGGGGNKSKPCANQDNDEHLMLLAYKSIASQVRNNRNSADSFATVGGTGAGGQSASLGQIATLSHCHERLIGFHTEPPQSSLRAPPEKQTAANCLKFGVEKSLIELLQGHTSGCSSSAPLDNEAVAATPSKSVCCCDCDSSWEGATPIDKSAFEIKVSASQLCSPIAAFEYNQLNGFTKSADQLVVKQVEYDSEQKRDQKSSGARGPISGSTEQKTKSSSPLQHDEKIRGTEPTVSSMSGASYAQRTTLCGAAKSKVICGAEEVQINESGAAAENNETRLLLSTESCDIQLKQPLVQAVERESERSVANDRAISRPADQESSSKEICDIKNCFAEPSSKRVVYSEATTSENNQSECSRPTQSEHLDCSRRLTMDAEGTSVQIISFEIAGMMSELVDSLVDVNCRSGKSRELAEKGELHESALNEVEGQTEGAAEGLLNASANRSHPVEQATASVLREHRAEPALCDGQDADSGAPEEFRANKPARGTSNERPSGTTNVRAEAAITTSGRAAIRDVPPEADEAKNQSAGGGERLSAVTIVGPTQSEKQSHEFTGASLNDDDDALKVDQVAAQDGDYDKGAAEHESSKREASAAAAAHCKGTERQAERTADTHPNNSCDDLPVDLEREQHILNDDDAVDDAGGHEKTTKNQKQQVQYANPSFVKSNESTQREHAAAAARLSIQNHDCAHVTETKATPDISAPVSLRGEKEAIYGQKPCVGLLVGATLDDQSRPLNRRGAARSTIVDGLVKSRALTGISQQRTQTLSLSEEDEGSCSSGFGPSATNSSSAASSASSDGHSIREKHLTAISGEQNGVYSRPNSSKIPNHSIIRSENRLYDSIRSLIVRDQAPTTSLTVNHYSDCQQFVGPDQAYPNGSERPLVIENYGYASLINHHTHHLQMTADKSSALVGNMPKSFGLSPAYHQYANLPGNRWLDDSVEYATVKAPKVPGSFNQCRVMTADGNRMTSSRSEISLNSGQSLSPTSGSSTNSAGFSKLPPARILNHSSANKTDADSTQTATNESDARVNGSQDATNQQKKSMAPSLFKRFGSLVSKAFNSTNTLQQQPLSIDPTLPKVESGNFAHDACASANSHTQEEAAEQPVADCRREAKCAKVVVEERSDAAKSETREVDLVILPAKNQHLDKQTRSRQLEPENELRTKFPTGASRTTKSNLIEKRSRGKYVNVTSGRLTDSSYDSSTGSSSSAFCSSANNCSDSCNEGNGGVSRAGAARERNRRIKRSSSMSDGMDSLISYHETDGKKLTSNKLPVSKLSMSQTGADVFAAKSDRSLHADDIKISKSERRIDIDCVSPRAHPKKTPKQQQVCEKLDRRPETKSGKSNLNSRSLLGWFGGSGSSTVADSLVLYEQPASLAPNLDAKFGRGNKTNGESINSMNSARNIENNHDKDVNCANSDETQKHLSGFWGFSSIIEQRHAKNGAEGVRKKKPQKKLGLSLSKSLSRSSYSKELDNELEPKSLMYSAVDGGGASQHRRSTRHETSASDDDENSLVRQRLAGEEKCQSLNLYQNLLRNYVKRRRSSHHKHSGGNHHAHHERSTRPVHHCHQHQHVCRHHHRRHHRQHHHYSSHRHHSLTRHHTHAPIDLAVAAARSGHKNCLNNSAARFCTDSCSSSEVNLVNKISSASNIIDRRGVQKTNKVWGQLIKINKSTGSQVVELQRVPGSSWGFFVARGALNNTKGIFISRMHENLASGSFDGLLSVGDRLLAIDNNTIEPDYDIMRVNQMMSMKNKILLKVKPFKG